MGAEMDHARCSESLPLYLRGELEPARADAVRRHLDVCEQCSAERRALEVLEAGALEPLSAGERNRIHAAISEAVAEESTQTVLAPARKPLWTRLAPALAGAATLLLIVVGALYLGDAGTGFDTAGEGGGSPEGAPDALRVEDSGAGQGTVTDDAAGTALYAGDIGKVTVSSLGRDTRRRALLRNGGEADTAFSAADETAGGDATEPEAGEEAAKLDAGDAADNLRVLRAQADIAVGRQMADCARSVASAVPYETVPVYAAKATLKGDRVLLMGFKWAKREGRELDRFMLWAWPIGDCRIPVFYGSSGPPKRPQE
jgi:hypothetical protein